MSRRRNVCDGGGAGERRALDAVVHVDLDGARQIYAVHGWRYEYDDDPLFVSGMENLLRFLRCFEIRATLFVIAADVDEPEKYALLRRAVDDGHEIACHTLTHSRLSTLTFREKKREIGQGKRRLEDALGVRVKGFRAPSYDIDRDCLELLDEYEYLYDSSAFPNERFARRLGVNEVPALPHRPLADRALVELPLPGHDPFPFPFHPCYSLLLGQKYFEWGLRRQKKRRLPLVLLFHLTDFADSLPKERLRGWKSKLFTLSHLSSSVKEHRCGAMIDRLRRDYVLTSTDALVSQAAEGADGAAMTGSCILGISTTHETGAAVICNGRVQAAISEERLDRTKFSTRYPPVQSIRAVFETGKVHPRDVTDVVVAGLPLGRLLARIVPGQIRDVLDFHCVADYFPHFCKVLYRLFYVYRAAQYGKLKSHLFQTYGVRPRFHYLDHHLCHASAAYRTAPFDDALIVTADGVGDDLSFTVSTGRRGRIEQLLAIPYPHSFGQFYTACTQVLGFRGGRHEGKITGLSGYGRVDNELYRKIKGTIRRSGPDFALDKRYYSEGFVRGFSLSKIRSGESLFEALQYRNYKKPLKKLVQRYPREDVAAVFQRLLEEEMIAVVRPYAKSTGLKNLALCGGVFANVKLNDALFRALDMENLYIFPHMGDGGLSVGAALEHLQVRPRPFDTIYWGQRFNEAQMERALRSAHNGGLRFERMEDIERTMADRLVDGSVIARFNGAMEFGPRALCNRSILYRASDPSANRWLNERLGRTEFMPFAPVALREKAGLLFEDIEGTEHACKFMTTILKCTEFTKEKCPAIVHVDGTARPQFVSEEINASAYRVLRYYEERTGIPLLVNTSFNMHEEPIVCTPEDAVRAFLASGIDYLAMGPFLAEITKDRK